MEHRRMAWAACVVAITTLGVSGIVAGGCGGDDNAAPGATAGSAGSGGSGGGTAGSAGSAGKAGSGGSTGGSKADGGGKDAAPDVDYHQICAASADSGSSCSDMCICDNCAMQAVVCFGNPSCRALVDCANTNACNDPDTAKAVICAMSKCPTEYTAAIANGAAGLTQGAALASCVATANCDSKCSGDGGTTDVTTSDVKPDVTTSDVTTSDVTTTDTATPDTGTNEAATPDTGTSEAAASDATTSDATTTEAAAEAGGD